MALKLTVDSLDGLDDAQKAFYVEKDGRFTLDVDGMEDTSGLKSALEKERRQAKELARKVSKWESLGKSDEEIAELVKKAEEAALSEAERKGEWDKLRQQMNDKHATELKAREDAVAKMRTTLERHLIDAAATSAIAAEKGVPALLLPHVQRHVRVIEQDGEFVAQVVNEKGDPRVNGKGEPLAISDLVAEMKQSEIFGRAFEGSGQSGSGKQPASNAGGSGSQGGVPKSWAEAKTPEQKAAFLQSQKPKG